MKKKLLVLAMTGVITASLLTACGGKETAATTAVETTTMTEIVTTAETTDAETTEATDAETATEVAGEEDQAITNYDEYLSWTSEEWTAASDEDKLSAAIVYSVYTTEAIGGEAFDAETKALVIQQMREAEDIQNVVDQLDATLPSFADKSIKDFADVGVEQINSLTEETSAAN